MVGSGPDVPCRKTSRVNNVEALKMHTDAACCLEWRQEVKADYDTVGKAGEESDKPTARLQ